MRGKDTCRQLQYCLGAALWLDPVEECRMSAKKLFAHEEGQSDGRLLS